MIKMQAVHIREPGGPEVLTVGAAEVREPGPSELLVSVRAAGLNRADTLQRRGFYPAPPGAPATIPGLEYAGVVEATGDRVQGFAPGDRVMGISSGGAMATKLVVHEREALPVPDGMKLETAAAIPEVFLTAFDALFRQASLGLGDRCLLHSVGSGVGTAALQLANRVGARVLGTSRTAEKLERCRSLGTFDAIEVHDGRFAEAVHERVGGADLILDGVGAAYLQENCASLALRGTIVVIGLMGGVQGELPLGQILRKRATIRGTVLRSRPLEEKAELTQEFRRRVLPHFSGDGPLQPVIDEVLPMSEVAAAHARMEANETFGKLVLAWPQDV
ncbi:MAG: NAD(P)H-quinone oxidoreductase [Myxococcota bacterium]